MTNVINERPPNFDAIHAVFPGAAGEGVVFAYGDRIYNPSGTKLPSELLDHELVHCERQLAMGIDAWWEQYLVDPKFRYDEELLAHIAEFKSIISKYSYDRHAMGRVRQRAIEHVARKLSAPLYDRMVTVHQAITAIRKGAAA